MELKDRMRDALQLTADEIRELPRERTIVLLPVGILENHGPHLVIGTDSLIVQAGSLYIAEELIRVLPDWYVLLFPAIPFGTQTIDELTEEGLSEASFPVSSETLRDLVAEAGYSIAHSGFRYIVALSRHGGPRHINSIVLACEFISESYHTRMWCVRLGTSGSLIRQANHLVRDPFTEEELAKFEHEIHAGCMETSWMLYIHPDLVKELYRTLAPNTIASVSDAYALARKPDFPYHFGSPSWASSEFGGRLMAAICDHCVTEIAEVAMGRANPVNAERHSNASEQISADRRQLDQEAQFRREFADWLGRHNSDASTL